MYIHIPPCKWLLCCSNYTHIPPRRRLLCCNVHTFHPLIDCCVEVYTHSTLFVTAVLRCTHIPPCEWLLCWSVHTVHPVYDYCVEVYTHSTVWVTAMLKCTHIPPCLWLLCWSVHTFHPVSDCYVEMYAPHIPPCKWLLCWSVHTSHPVCVEVYTHSVLWVTATLKCTHIPPCLCWSVHTFHPVSVCSVEVQAHSTLVSDCRLEGCTHIVPSATSNIYSSLTFSAQARESRLCLCFSSAHQQPHALASASSPPHTHVRKQDQWPH